MKIQITSKKSIEIDKAQSSMLLTIALATIITVFCLVSAKALLSQMAYQQRVISARHDAANQLQDNIRKANTLVTQYNDVFEGGVTNAIGGKNDTTSSAVPPDIDNGRLVLDALPTTYDYPALLTSLQKALTLDSIGSPSITGSDQSTSLSSAPTSNPSPVKIDLAITGTANYTGAQGFITDLGRSIRPFDITKMTLSGNESSMVLQLNISTYYQPAKSLLVNSKEIR